MDITKKQYSINGALLTILQNKVATNAYDSDVLLFGSDVHNQQIKTGDRQE